MAISPRRARTASTWSRAPPRRTTRRPSSASTVSRGDSATRSPSPTSTSDVEPGQIVGVIGPSGAGKTTAVRLMTGELLPTEGTVRVLGEDPTELSGRARQSIGFMPQQFALYDDLTASENVDFVASMFGLLFRGRRRRTRRVLELLGPLGGSAPPGRRPVRRACSGACSWRRPSSTTRSLVFLDEPTAGVDPLLRETIWTELDRLRDDGRTLIVTTQYVGEAERCDVVALIADGRLLAFAPPDALRGRRSGARCSRSRPSAPSTPPTSRSSRRSTTSASRACARCW